MNIEFEEEVIDLIADIGYDPEYGARPMQRAIQNQIENPLSGELLKEKFQKGDTIKVGVKNNKVEFNKK
jgi:ATP-dependent Clp protease ATP-binding subunit ClpB